MIPQDPFILLSWINTQLRDRYDTLDALCEEEGVKKAELTAKLAALDSATMDTIDWQELHPTEPMLFFTPKDTAGEAEWNAAFGIAELTAKLAALGYLYDPEQNRFR